MDLRPFVRFLAERFPKLAPWAVRLRSLLHLLVGNPIQTLAGLDALLLWWLFGWPGRWLLAGVRRASAWSPRSPIGSATGPGAG